MASSQAQTVKASCIWFLCVSACLCVSAVPISYMILRVTTSCDAAQKGLFLKKKAGELLCLMSSGWWKGNECQGVGGGPFFFHLFWLQPVGNSRLSKASHHLFFFLDMSVLRSVKLGNFLFRFQQRKDLIAALSLFLASQMLCVWISIPLPAFFSFYFISSSLLIFPHPKPTHLWF